MIIMSLSGFPRIIWLSSGFVTVIVTVILVVPVFIYVPFYIPGKFFVCEFALNCFLRENIFVILLWRRY